MRNSLLGFCVLLLLAISVRSQELINATRIGTMTAATVNARMKTTFGESGLPAAAEPLHLYKITYRTPDVNGKSAIVSGLVVFPRGGAPNGLVVFNHGTTADRNNVPSRYTGAAKPGEAESAILGFASGGYAVAMPDYLGLGDHKGAHPYPLGSINARAAIDIIKPARTLANRQRVDVGSRLFVTGYSEGGAVAMWTTRKLEEMRGADYEVTASAPLSGPYDLSGATREWLIKDTNTQEEFLARLYLMGYMTYSFRENRGIKLTGYYNLIMSNAVWRAFRGSKTDIQIVKDLGIAAFLSRSKNSLRNVLKDRYIRALETTDTSDPVVRELKANDVYDWSPRTQMLLVNLINDQIVVPENTQKAFETMRSRGVGRDTLRRYVIRDASLNHGTGMPLAVLQARRFFDGGFANVRDAQ